MENPEPGGPEVGEGGGILREEYARCGGGGGGSSGAATKVKSSDLISHCPRARYRAQV